MDCDYFAALRHGHAYNNDAEEKHKAGNPRAYDKAIEVPSSCHDLTDEGKRQAVLTGEWLREHGFEFEEHVVSGFLRTMRTASLLAIPDAQWIIDERLCEKDSGILNTLTPSKVRLHIEARGHIRHKHDPYRFRPEHGESFMDVDGRIRPSFEEIRRRRLTVCHGHVIRVLDRVIMGGMNAWEFGLFNAVSGDVPNGALIEYKRVGDLWMRRQSIPHLGDPPQDNWTPIIPVRYSNEDLTGLIERVLSRVEELKGEAAA